MALLRPLNNIIPGIRKLKQIFRTFVRKKKIIPFFCSKVSVLPSKFQASCTLLGGEQRFLLPSQRPPTFVFHEPPDGVFPPTRPLFANCCESCFVEFPLLYLAFFRTFFSCFIQDFRSRSFLVFETFICRRLFYFPTFGFFQFFSNFFY